MKGKIRRRLLAIMLCLAMLLNGNVSLLANDDTTAEDQTVVEETVDALEEIAEEVEEEVVEEATEEVVEETAEEAPSIVETIGEFVDELFDETTEEVVEEEIASESADDVLTLKTELNGTTITMSGPKSSFPEGIEYSVSASEISEEALGDVEASLRKVELETNEKIVSYKAYDIKLIVDGKEVQPVGDVEVTFQGSEVKAQVAKAENVEVYHVDEDKQEAVAVEGDVQGNEVVMTTDHFSTYVITTTNSSGVTVTVQHYLTSDKSQLYRDSHEQLTVDQRLEDISVAANYTVDKVVKISGSTETEVTGSDVITENTTYRVYYSPTTGNTTGTVQLFDYQLDGSGSDNDSINDPDNYPAGSAANTRFASGTTGNQYGSFYVTKSGTRYDTTISRNGKTLYINTWNRNSSGSTVNTFNGDIYGEDNAMTGIITGVNYATGELEMGTNSSGATMVEPGFFSTATKYGKQIYTDYRLAFSRSGDTYTLTGVNKPDGTRATTSYNSSTGANFYPLNHVSTVDNTSRYNSSNNYFFGLRYDIEFSIGDYNGPLNYSFTGDDDLWVILDAQDNGGEVIIDLGGIHGALTQEVDIWETLGLEQGVATDEQRAEKHTLTILYMERGGNDSNCKMQFTLPNSKMINSAVNPVDFEFTKVNSGDTALAGATFGLYDSHDTLLGTATSDADGKVKFENLYDGTYTVKETKAPSGYVKDTTEWTLTVVNRVATMTASGSADAVTTVVNYTQNEEAVSNITNNKTATLVDAATRTFKLNLSAATRGETEGTEATSASIILVLDASSSMSENNAFRSLKNAVAGTDSEQGFIDKIAAVSPNSKIGIVWYSGSEDLNQSQTSSKDFTTLNTTDNISSLKRFVNNEEADGGTPMGDALETAYNMLKDDTSNNARYVIFFTDGMPGHWPNSTSKNCMVANNAEYYADKIKSSTDGKAVLYTVGYNLGDETFSWNNTHGRTGSSCGSDRGHTSMRGSAFLSTVIATSSSHAYTASSISDLNTQFDSLAGTLGSLLAVQADRVVDVIDSRFELTDASQKALKDAYGDNVEITTVNGVTTITWLNEAAKIANEKDGGWSQEIIVQAKPDFVGGNAIPTNGSQSGIVIDGQLIPFPQPSVNVQILDLALTGTEITVYKGDIIDTTVFAKTLADTLKVTQLYDEAGQQVSVFPELTEAQLTTLNTTGVLELDYSYEGTADVVGTFKFELTVSPESAKVELNHSEMVSGSPAETYTLKVSYIPREVSDRLTELGNVTAPTGGEAVTTKTATADYKVNVISGEIQLTKTLKETSNVDQTFTFSVKNGDVEKTVTITVPAGELSASYTGTELKDLARGTYTITEKDVKGYVISSVDIYANITNCENNKVDTEFAESATFVLGNNVAGENVIKAFAYDAKDGGTLGAANFTNEVAIKDWSIVKRSSSSTSENTIGLAGAEFELRLVDGTEDSVWYKGISGEKGVVTWYKNGTTELGANEYILKGVYTLKETKAPAGYSVNNVTWTVTVAAKGYLKSIVESEKGYSESSFDGEKLMFYIDNSPLYELPQSGGMGIYTYMIGGIMLMAFATFVLYKSRRKEVLAR